MIDVPNWLSDYIRAWAERLNLQGWTIRTGVALCVNDDPDARACCAQYPDINEAHLTFRADVEDTSEWRRTVIHEMLHIRHARVDHLVERAILPRLTSEAQMVAMEVYHQHVESFIETMAGVLYRAAQHLDYPDEQD